VALVFWHRFRQYRLERDQGRTDTQV
jgi:hypothetical protein